MMRPVVLLFGPSPDALSGVSTHVRTLLSSALAKEFDIRHFRVGSEGRREGAIGRWLRLGLSPLQLLLRIVTSGAQIVHLNASLDARGYWRDLVYWAVARLCGRRVLNQVHGGAMPHQFFGGKRLRTAILRRFLVSSDVVTVLSNAELRAYRAFDPRINVHVVPNAISPAVLADDNRRFNLDAPLRLVYIGRLVRGKGLFELVEAVANLARAGRELSLTIAGDGADAAALSAEVRAHGIADRVHFVGPVTGDAKARLWAQSDVFVLASHYEGLPYALLEAMAAGCAPVATPVAAIPDVVCDGQHGLLVPAADPAALAEALARLDDDRDALVRIARAARLRVVEHYLTDRLVADMRTLYNDCLA